MCKQRLYDTFSIKKNDELTSAIDKICTVIFTEFCVTTAVSAYARTTDV